MGHQLFGVLIGSRVTLVTDFVDDSQLSLGPF